MSYHKWFHDWFKQRHRRAYQPNPLNVDIDSAVWEVFELMEYRGSEYLENNEVYKELWINPKDDIVNSKPQINQQVREELFDFLKILLQHETKSVLQIGLGHYGSTHFAMSLLFDKVVTVEYDIKNIRAYTDREILYNQNKEVFVHGDSTGISARTQALHHGQYDCIFVDGNHSYSYVKEDYENYLPMLRSGGIFAFHDAKLDAERYGTPQVLREIKHIHDIKTIDHSNEVGIACFIKE